MVKNRIKKKVGKREDSLKPKERLLKYLIEHKELVTIKRLSELVGMDYKNTYNYVKELNVSGAIVQKIIGNTSPVEINISRNQEIIDVENIRMKELLDKNPKLRLIKNDIEEIGYPFMIVLIFGSYIKGFRTGKSDIDICIISDNKEQTKKLIQSIGLLSLKLDVHEFTTDEFISMIKLTKNNLGNEIVNNNIIFYGIENYYNLISKWMKKE